MSFVLSVYSKNAFKEYLLPAINNSNYSLLVSRELFGLNTDIELPMEIIDGKWYLEKNLVYSCSYSKTKKIYEGECLENADVLSLEVGNGDELSIVVKESQDVFSVFQKYDIVNLSEITIGKDRTNIFSYDYMGLVSKYHAVIKRNGNSYLVEDKSLNGCFINGKRISETYQLCYGDCLDIFGLRIVFLGQFIAVNDMLDDLSIQDDILKKYVIRKSFVVHDEPIKEKESKLFHRSPRNIPKIETEKIEIEAPPNPKELVSQPTFMAIGPSITMALPMLMGCALSIYGTRMNGGNSGIFMYTGLVTAVGSALTGVIWSVVNIRHAKKRNREDELKRFEIYSEYLINRANEIKAKYENNTIGLRKLYPETAKCCEYDRNSIELWNRNYKHTDFLSQRLGIGAIPFQVDIEIPKERFNLINDSLADKPKLMKESYKYLQDVPVCLDLLKHKMVGVVGGASKGGCFTVMYNIVGQIAANNCYTDVKMVFIFDESKEYGTSIWEFAKWLPHVWSEDKRTRFVAGNKSDASEVFYELTKVLRMRAEDNSRKNGFQKKIDKPYYILFLENEKLLEGELISKYVYNTSEDYGISTIVMVESYEELPNACEYIIENTDEYKGMYHVADGLEDRIAIDFDKITADKLETFARRLAPIEVKEEETSGEIPNTLTFFEMYGVNSLEEFGVVERWKKNRTYDSMKALVGQKAGGNDCFLDVHEKYHGPHGLVAGTTGSGKSETLQTYMLSLALNYSPDDIGFFVIDYKGGGMANLFEGLPHLIGSISNLSGNQVRRAMVSIKSENLRRQRIFNEHGVNNINLYTRLYKNNEANIPCPHMFIIIDEFAELKREEPDFMRELISVAQVGRSLGVHLILATQKPSGTVDDNIWSNSKFRLCLRVQDRQDSNDMLHKPDAAYITQAGRCYLQVGNDELYEQFQSGWSGAAFDENAGSIQTNIAQLLSINGKAALVGSHAKIQQKEMVKQQWIEKLIILVERVSSDEKYDVWECKHNTEFCQKFAKDMFGYIEEAGIEYAESDYNMHRIQDLLVSYAEIFDDCEEKNTEAISKNIIRYAVSCGKKLPEMKEKTQLDAVIEYLAIMAKKNGYTHNLQLWLPVLPTELFLSQLSGFDVNSFDGNEWPKKENVYSLKTIVGLYDDPENQAQQPICVDLAVDGNHAIIGTVVSGKSTFLMTYIYSLINRYTPDVVNLYILDYSSKMLGALTDAPHIGGVMYEEDDEKVAKFFTMLTKMLQERKYLFKGGSYSQFIKANGLVVPSVVVVIDNMASFRTKNNNKYDDLLMNILKEGINYGIYVIATAAGFGMNEIPNRLGENFRSVICLEMNDKFAYSDALRTLHIEVFPEENVKGRGITKIGDRILEFQTALTAQVEGDDYKRSEIIKERCKKLMLAWKGKTARVIPSIPEKPVWSEFAQLEEVEMMANNGIRMPIGYDKTDASVYGIDLSKTYCYLVSGKSRTGKSNMLRVAIKSAATMEGEIAVIDFGGDLEYIANAVEGEYINSIEKMQKYFEDLIPKFKERNKAKKSYDASGISNEEIFEKMQNFKKIFIFVWDLPEFIIKANKPGEGYTSMTAFLSNLLDKGSLHNVYWFAGYNQDDQTKVLGENVYKLFIRDGLGIHFGGKVEEQHALSFEHLPYNLRGKSYKPGIGMLPSHDDDTTNYVVIPLYKAEEV